MLVLIVQIENIQYRKLMMEKLGVVLVLIGQETIQDLPVNISKKFI
jgi:hypothetical protein